MEEVDEKKLSEYKTKRQRSGKFEIKKLRNIKSQSKRATFNQDIQGGPGEGEK